MPTAPHLPIDPETHRVLWTRDATARLVEAGILEGVGVELLEGNVFRKGKNRAHVIALVRLLALLRHAFPEDRLQPEGPIDVAEEDNPTSAPEPDVAVLTRPVADFPTRNPSPSEIVLVVEIADSTRARDLGEKARLYARARIAEYWVLDLVRRQLHVHRHPEGGAWRERTVLSEGESVTPASASRVTLPVAEMLPGSGADGSPV